VTQLDDLEPGTIEPALTLHLLNEVQRLSRTGSFAIDLVEGLHTWSDEFYRICEVDRSAEVSTVTLASMVVPDDLPCFNAALDDALAGLGVAFEFRIATKSGAIKHLHASITRLSAVSALAATVTDMSDRRKEEERLRQTDGFLAKAQEISVTGSFYSRAETREFIWSEQLHRIFEFPVHNPVTAEEIAARYHPDDRILLEQALGRAQTGIDIDYEHRLLFPDGRIKHVHVFATMAPGESDNVEYFGAVQDVTERYLGEKTLDRVRSELEHATRVMSLSTLTASIAHEVSQPLAGIMTNADASILLLTADQPNIAGAIESARRTLRDGKRASAVIDRLRALFSKRPFTPSLVDINEIAAEVIELTLYDLRRRRIAVKTEFEKYLPSASGDRVQLQQVVLNLVQNAAEAMAAEAKDPRVLTIRTALDESGGVRLSVHDKGVGVSAEDLERLCDPFFTTKPQGMGIGLSVSRGIIERHQGRLWADANDGPGITVSFTLPCVPRNGAQSRAGEATS
jgi:signal transduction histidine kinase